MGNLQAKRDWGHAKDYVEMQWLMLQQKEPDDFVIASGNQYSVKDFILWAAKELGLILRFEGSGLNEVGIIEEINIENKHLNIGDIIVRVDPRYFRPSEVETLLGDASKAKKKLNWSPKIDARTLCAEMVKEDLKTAKKNALLLSHGYQVDPFKE